MSVHWRPVKEPSLLLFPLTFFSALLILPLLCVLYCRADIVSALCFVFPILYCRADIVSSSPPASPLFVNCRSWGNAVAHFQPLNSERSCFVNLSALSPGRCGQPIGNMWNYTITCEVWLSLAKSYGPQRGIKSWCQIWEMSCQHRPQ